MRKCLVEFIGTFFLVFTIGNVVIEPGIGKFAPIAVGSVLIGLIYAGGHISGAHYNPAVTMSFWLRGRFDKREILPYVISQLLAAILASLIVIYLKNSPVIIQDKLDIYLALLVEFLFTFALCFVILNVSTSKKTEGNQYYGIAIGFIVIASAYSVGGISGGVFNPAVALGICIMGITSMDYIWIFVLANFLGGVVAALIFKYLNPDDI